MGTILLLAILCEPFETKFYAKIKIIYITFDNSKIETYFWNIT